MGRFKDKDFKKMQFQIHGKTELVIDIYPTLKLDAITYFENTQLQNRADKLLRYVIFLYDKGSPLAGITLLKERKIEALELVKMSLDVSANRILSNDSPEINSICALFFRTLNDKKWALRCNLEIAYFTLLDNLSLPIKDVDAEKRKAAYSALLQCAKDAVEINSHIEAIDKEFRLNGDDLADVASDILSIGNKESMLEQLVLSARVKDKESDYED